METHHFWAFFVIALIAGASIALVINNTKMTGYQIAQPAWSIVLRRLIPFPDQFGQCIDTDRGIKNLTQGTCSDSTGNYTDYCIDAYNVGEYYCKAGKCKIIKITCKSPKPQCLNGMCVPPYKEEGLPVTYQGVLNMLNRCTFSIVNENISCDMACGEKTCIMATYQTYINNTPVYYKPAQCSSTDGRRVCVCCSP